MIAWHLRSLADDLEAGVVPNVQTDKRTLVVLLDADKVELVATDTVSQDVWLRIGELDA